MPRRALPANLFGRRLRDARMKAGLPQDKLGVSIGLDEESSSARISRYETGAHEPALATAASLAFVLGVPLAYLYCEDEGLAKLLLHHAALSAAAKEKLQAFAAELAAAEA